MFGCHIFQSGYGEVYMCQYTVMLFADHIDMKRVLCPLTDMRMPLCKAEFW